MGKAIEGKCPKCNSNIDDEIARRWYSDIPVTNFEFECPYCSTLLEVEAVPSPVFMVTLPATVSETSTPVVEGGGRA